MCILYRCFGGNLRKCIIKAIIFVSRSLTSNSLTLGCPEGNSTECPSARIQGCSQMSCLQQKEIGNDLSVQKKTICSINDDISVSGYWKWWLLSIYLGKCSHYTLVNWQEWSVLDKPTDRKKRFPWIGKRVKGHTQMFQSRYCNSRTVK